MQQLKFIAGIKNPSSIKKNSEDLLFLIGQFPYCQTVQMMYAQNLKLNNAIIFEQQLKKAASYCTDRHQLFNHFRQLNDSQQDQSLHTKPTSATEQLPEIPNYNNPKDPQDSPEKIKSTQFNVADFEKSYLAEAISSSILLETTPYEMVNDTNKIEYQTTVDEANFDVKKAHTFNDWISYFNMEKTASSIKFSEEITKKSLIENELVEKFIQENPKIKPKKAEFYSPVNMARISVIDDNEIVSETLALVHVDQGNYKKAISMYKKLSLKIPKKRSYFALQIKNLTQKLK